MCGIVGIYSRKEQYIQSQQVERGLKTLEHRGPDDFGIFCKENVVLGHRRLSIIDLSAAAHQPMSTEDGRYILIFNGEIYNFVELRKRLISLGYSFKSESDTEVILLGFCEWGCSLFKILNGIFAFAIFDQREKKLFIVRDRLGVKPLYLYEREETIYFASEIKAIIACCSGLNQLNTKALSSFLFFGNALGTETLYKDVTSVSPGSYFEISNNGIRHFYYWRPEDVQGLTGISADGAALNVRSLLEASVSRQLVSDVPIGVFLSGGIDSSAITAFASKHYNGKLKTFSAAFDFDKGINELDNAHYVSEYFDTEHTELFIRGQDLPDVIDQMIYHHDQPFSDAANIPLFLMSKAVKPFATVILQGDGGDELFAGYNRYMFLKKYGSGFTRQLLKLLYPIFQKLPYSSNQIRQILRIACALGEKEDANMLSYLLTMDTRNCNTRQVLSKEFQKVVLEIDAFTYYHTVHDRFKERDLVQRMLYIDTQIILPDIFLEKVDKSTMAASIEARVPFLDNDLVEYALSLPSNIKMFNNEKKGLLRKALRGIVPDRILDGPKTGFGVPFENWLREPLYNFMNDNLRSDYVRNLKIFNYDRLDYLIKEHKNKRGNYGFQLWKLMNLSIWLKKYAIKVDN